MSFSFQCPVCRSVRSAADHVFGKRVRCADCDNFVTVDDSTIVYPDEPAAELSEDMIEESAPENPYVISDADVLKTANPDDLPTVTPIPVDPVPGGSEPSRPVENTGRSTWRVDDSGQDGGSNDSTSEGEEDDFEAVNLSKGGKRSEDEMDMTPMVDVTFLLLIFFMVTASFTLQKSMDLPTKTQDEPSPNVVVDFEDNPEYVSVFVSPFNEYRVRTSEYDWEDAPNRHELNVRLRDAKEAISKPEKLLIMAHADCFHDKVIQAMDIGIEHEYKIQVIMTEEEF